MSPPLGTALPSHGRASCFRPLAAAVVAVLFALPPPARPATAGTPLPLAAACDTDNPYLAVPQYVMTGAPDQAAMVAFRASPDGRSGHEVLATQEQIGATWGLGVDGDARTLYAAAFHKRATAFGPGGPGGIYRVDLASGEVAEWARVPDSGEDAHGPAGDGRFDQEGRDAVGKVGLGDLDLSEDGRELYAVNLNTRRILRYRVSDRQLLGAFAHGAADQPWAEAEARPFALAYRRGLLYHGVLRDASSGQDAADLHAYVYESLPDGSRMRLVLDFGLDYAWQGPHYEVPATWKPWLPSGQQTLRGDMFIWPQPWLTDIAFTDVGDMVLGLRDRNGDRTLFEPGGALPPGERNGQQGGDILIARRQGLGWRMDENPEFFGEDASRAVGATWDGHPETGFGGLAFLPGARQVVMSALSPLQYSSGGALWFDAATGKNPRREELYVMRAGQTFGKANGLGDVEMLCPPPRPRPIYLPFLEKSKPCNPDAFRTDVILVLDRSTSMLRPVAAGGQPKNAAAIAAARAFVAQLQLEGNGQGLFDQVGIVGFNDQAWIEQGLTHDRGAALAALDRIAGRSQEGTRLDLAFAMGRQALEGPGRMPRNRPVIIVLTDGLPNRVPFGDGSPYPGSRRQEDSVLQAAQAAKASGARVYTVGLGTPRDILPWLMIAAASERWMYHYAPDGSALAGIYAQIAATFNECRPAPTPRPCQPEEQHADLVLVLDLSSSMARSTRAGRSKAEAALEAARSFARLLDLERDGWGRQDQIGIVGFNGQAWIQISLGDDAAAVAAAIDALGRRMAEGTRLDLALAQGQALLAAGPRLQGNTATLVLMTDGLPNQVPFGPGSAAPDCPDQECVVLRAAAAVKAAGTRVFAIGLGEGEDVLRPLLQAVASRPADFLYTPDPEDLAGIYRAIAGRIQVCP